MEITTKLAFRIPEEIVRYIKEFLNLCQGCYRFLPSHDVLRCSECKRSWCQTCQLSPNLIRERYHPTTGQLDYICAWCMREARSTLSG
jgi:hypothetical protein